MVYIPQTLDGIPAWIACLHLDMVETSRARDAETMAFQYWCPDCGARKQVVLSRT